ncbi:hypothetical protein MIN45_P2013 [Methylomarinovum tepidoasis]|uniref:Nitroreductase domain-containing protein n=1 Tax=Methylomarinovum tepidoasis TaxID=2840183 RepID=A0AAU9CAV6_9GAMM|nr:SagB/ThcOx family dehydrogenase [Methylomarinovum sp. IN45]BCX89640.1 hypothetical protein MIN45_P2013 [Methylomarinovum sp. IN45]
MPFVPGRVQTTPLPQPQLENTITLEQALLRRRSVRSYQPVPVTLAALGQLLWAAQGISGREGFRTAPSAGALYPLEVLLAVSRCDELAPGLYHYRPLSHDLVLWRPRDHRPTIAAAALDQECLHEAAAILVITAVPARTAVKYGTRATRYVHLEAGHAAQNACLQAAALGLGTVTVGAFDDMALAEALALPEAVEPVYLLPVGVPV